VLFRQTVQAPGVGCVETTDAVSAPRSTEDELPYDENDLLPIHAADKGFCMNEIIFELSKNDIKNSVFWHKVLLFSHVQLFYNFCANPEANVISFTFQS